MDATRLDQYRKLFGGPRSERPEELFCIVPAGSSPASRRTGSKPPTDVGPFSVLKELGSGGFASTVLAVNEATAERVAVKLLLPKRLTDTDVAETFLGEQSIAEKLGKPESRHLAKFRSAGLAASSTGSDVPFIVMEYVAGRTLRHKLSAWPNGLPQIDVVRIGTEICEALQEIHVKGFTHRDLKPTNIILDSLSGERVVVVDFGIATSLFDFLGQKTAGGTWNYTAPARIETRGEDASVELNPAVDLFGLGCILFELLTGSAAFTLCRDKSRNPDIRRLVDDMRDSVAIRSRLHSIHPNLRSIVMKLMAADQTPWPSVPQQELATRVAIELADLNFTELNVRQSGLSESPQASSAVRQSIRELATKGYSIPPQWVQGSCGTLLGLVRRKRMSQELHDLVHQTVELLLNWMSPSGEGQTDSQREFNKSIQDISGMLGERIRHVREGYWDELPDPLRKFKDATDSFAQILEVLRAQIDTETRDSGRPVEDVRRAVTEMFFSTAGTLIREIEPNLVDDYAFVNDRLLMNLFSIERRL